MKKNINITEELKVVEKYIKKDLSRKKLFQAYTNIFSDQVVKRCEQD